MENSYYSKDYWFDNPEEHDDVDNYGPDYYVNHIYRDIIFKLNIPDEGFIVVLGTNRCVSFQLLCDFFGEERCIGYDIHNPTNHPRVIIKDCNMLGEADKIPIAFCHNDIGSFPTTPLLKQGVQAWAAPNVVKDGYFLGRNNLNRAKWNSERFMKQEGFVNTKFAHLDRKKFDLSNLDKQSIEGHMISRRIKNYV